MTITRAMTDVYNGPSTAGAILSPTIDLGLGDGTPGSMTTTWSTNGIYGGDSSTSTSSYVGFRFATGGIDLSTRSHIAFQIANQSLSRSNLDTFANGGMRVVFDDGTNWAAYSVYGSDINPFGSSAVGSFAGYAGFGLNNLSTSASWFIDRDNRTPFASSGTISWSSVTHVELHFKPASSGRMDAAIGRFATADSPIFTGTVSTSVWADGSAHYGNSSNGYVYPWVFRPAANYALSSFQVLQTLQLGLQIGDGSTTTTLTDSNLSIAAWGRPEDLDAAGDVPPNSVILINTPRLIDVFQSATDNVTLSDILWSCTSMIGLRVRGSTSGTFSANRWTFANCEQMELGHGSYADCIWTGTTVPVEITADTVITGDSAVRDSVGINVTGAAGDYSAISLNITNDNTGIGLTIGSGGAGTYDLTGITVDSGFTLNIWNESTTNAVTVEVASGFSTQPVDLWFAYDNEASGPFTEGETLTFGNGATATLVYLVDDGTTGAMYCELLTGSAPPDNNSITGGTSSATANVNEASGANSSSLTITQPTTTFTINTNVSALIRIYTNNTQTILDSTTGTSLAFTHTGQTVGYTIEASGYIPQRITGVTLSGTTSTTINLVADPIYNASHGLTFTTDYSYNASTRVMTIVANQEGRDLYSALIDDFQTETALRNCPFPLAAVGPDRIDFNAVGYYNTATTVGATIDSGDIQFWKGAGMQWEHDTTGNPTKKFYSIKSSNTLQAGSVVGYTQVVTGTPVEATLVSNQVNQVIQYFEDTNGDGTPDYNYTGHLLFKGFLTGYYQARWDVINDGGVSTLEPYEYNISLTQDAIAGTTGNQTITIATLTDHTGAPLSVGGKSFDYELVDPGTNTAENLLAQFNYDVYNAVNTSISGTLYTSYQAFDLPDLIIEAGANYETERGYFEGDGAVGDLSGVYLSRSSADHPGIARFQSNDGTYYTPAVTANATGTNLPDDVGGSTRLQITNLTALSASTWAATTPYTEGDLVLRSTGIGSESTAGLFFRCTSAGTSGGTEPTWVITTPGVFGTSGSETTDNTVTWECFAVLLYDSDPASTGWSDTYIDGYEFANGETARIRFAHLNGSTSFEYGDTTAAVTTSGFSFDGSLFLAADSVYASNAVDGSSTAVTNIFTADYANDEIDLDADLNFTSLQFFAFYCYELTSSQGMNQFWGGVTAIDEGNYRINDSIVSLYFDETAGFVRQTDTARIFRSDGTRPALDPTTGGAGVEVNWQLPVYVQAVGSALTGPQAASLSAIETATAGLTYTVANKVDANIHYVNNVQVDGVGSAGDPWGPV